MYSASPALLLLHHFLFSELLPQLPGLVALQAGSLENLRGTPNHSPVTSSTFRLSASRNSLVKVS
jgi:hypothetical protein